MFSEGRTTSFKLKTYTVSYIYVYFFIYTNTLALKNLIKILFNL